MSSPSKGAVHKDIHKIKVSICNHLPQYAKLADRHIFQFFLNIFGHPPCKCTYGMSPLATGGNRTSYHVVPMEETYLVLDRPITSTPINRPGNAGGTEEIYYDAPRTLTLMSVRQAGEVFHNVQPVLPPRPLEQNLEEQYHDA